MISEPGMYANIQMSEYISDPCPEPSVSTRVLSTIVNRSVLHARDAHPRFGGDGEHTRRADQGSAVHALTLEGPGAIVCIEANDYRKDDTKEKRDAAYAAGKIPVLIADMANLVEAASSARTRLATFGQGAVEQTMIWRTDNGVWCRARPDWISDDHRVIIDLKTCSNADPATWARSSLFSGAYDLQSSHVLSGMRELFGDDERQVIYLLVEIEPPFATSLVTLSGEAVALAERKRKFAMNKWAKAISTNTYPGYADGVYCVDAPAYHQYDFAAREGVCDAI